MCVCVCFCRITQITYKIFGKKDDLTPEGYIVDKVRERKEERDDRHHL